MVEKEKIMPNTQPSKRSDNEIILFETPVSMR
jgi:hypothetical protein